MLSLSKKIVELKSVAEVVEEIIRSFEISNGEGGFKDTLEECVGELSETDPTSDEVDQYCETMQNAAFVLEKDGRANIAKLVENAIEAFLDMEC